MEYSNIRQRTRWSDEIRAFAGAGWSTLTPDRGPGGEMRLKGAESVVNWFVTSKNNGYSHRK